MPTRKSRPLSDLSSALALNIDETAKVTGIGVTTITAEIKARRLKSRIIARKRIVLVSDLREWLDGLTPAPLLQPEKTKGGCAA
jgi:hypothetical protein